MINSRINKKKCFSILIFILIILFNVSSFSSTSSTIKYTKVTNNREPRVSFKRTEKENIYIILHDNAGIKTSKSYFQYQGKRYNVQLIENSGGAYTKDGKLIANKYKDKKYTGKRYDYGIKINKANVNKDYTSIFVFSYDYWESCFLKETFKIKRSDKKDKDGYYYQVNCAPRLTVELIKDKPYIKATDWSGIKTLKILSEKTREEIYSYTASKSVDNKKKNGYVLKNGINYPQNYSEPIKLNTFKKAMIDNNQYKIRVLAEDMGGIKNEKTMIFSLVTNNAISEKMKDSIEFEQSKISLSINPSKTTVEKDKTVQLKAVVNPTNIISNDITWTSSDTSIATVNKNTGVVKALKPGTATITAMINNGSGKKSTSTVTVTSSVLKELSKPVSNNAYMNNLKIRNDLNIADPFVLKANGYYYIYSTGSNGIGLARTKDFKTINGLPKVNTNNKSKFTAYWAPEVYYYNNKYYLFYTGQNSKTGPKIMVSTSNKPEGPFTNDYDIKSNVSNPMDATVLFDNNHIYMYTMSQDNKNVYVEELNSSLTKSISKAKKVLSFDSKTDKKKDRKKYWDWNQNEGPFVIKNGGTYYLMYSAGTYKNHTYTVGYATCSSPIGTFSKKTLGTSSSSGTASLLHGSYPDSGKYNSGSKIYGTGHNSIIKISNNELYIVYHSIVFRNNSFGSRKVQIDRLGISNGKLYVNGPTTEIQPLPSGSNGYYQLEASKYDCMVGNNKIKYLKDNINYNAEASAKKQGQKGLVYANKTKTNTLTVTINGNQKISDIWLMSTENGWNGVFVSARINNKYALRRVKFGNTGMGKFQLPNISENIKEVVFTFSKKVDLTEVGVYYKK